MSDFPVGWLLYVFASLVQAFANMFEGDEFEWMFSFSMLISSTQTIPHMRTSVVDVVAMLVVSILDIW